MVQGGSGQEGGPSGIENLRVHRWNGSTALAKETEQATRSKTLQTLVKSVEAD